MFNIPKSLRLALHGAADALCGAPNLLVQDSDPHGPTLYIITRHGFPAETHVIKTKDSYLLKVHRIAGEKTENFKTDPFKTRPVVFLQHGLFGSSADWILTGPGKGLGFLLADNGYDVWMGNSRGNKYSKYHASLKSDSEEFWNFSWDQMAEHDLPAVIDYILNYTKQKSLVYVGHSLGTTMFFAFISTHPEYRDKVKLMVALAPVAYLSNMLRPLRDLAKVAYEYPLLMSLFGKREFLPEAKMLMTHLRCFCGNKKIQKAICIAILNTFAGYSEHLDKDIYSFILDYFLVGTSTKTITHYMQLINSGKFSKFDFGEEKNKKVYNQTSSPLYPLDEVPVPVAAFYSDSDCFVSLKDVDILLKELSNVVYRQNVNTKSFNHFDFLYASDAPNLVYRQVISVIQDASPTN